MADIETFFNRFCEADGYTETLESFQQLKNSIASKAVGLQLYQELRNALSQDISSCELWSSLDKKLQQDVYRDGTICQETKVLIIGAGPCGLRMAIECAMLNAARVVVIDKRNYFTRHNILHIWPFIIHDVKALGGKFFYPKFCTGCLNHISIRRLQLILLKVALLLGVDVYAPVTFVDVVEPEIGRNTGWKAAVEPASHPVSAYEFDVIVGADSRRNSLGFQRKCFRGKLAIAITANFIRRPNRGESRVQEIPGLFYVFNPDFFRRLRQSRGIDLENFVYYKDDTHYVVMTAKKASLIKNGVLIEDLADAGALLADPNVNRDRLLTYAKDALNCATDFGLEDLTFATNHHGEEDVAIFDFTSMFQAESACSARVKGGKNLLECIVGDCALEPFWPTGSGCARGFLSVFDAAWLVRNWFEGKRSELELLAERETLFKVLSQTKTNNLKPACSLYSIDPSSRYGTILLVNSVSPNQVRHLYRVIDERLNGEILLDDDVMRRIEAPPPARTSNLRDRRSPLPSVRHPKEAPAPPVIILSPSPVKPMIKSPTESVLLLKFFRNLLDPYHTLVYIMDLHKSWTDGVAFMAIVNLFRPRHKCDLEQLKNNNPLDNLGIAFALIEDEFGVVPTVSVDEIISDKHAMLSYLMQIRTAMDNEIEKQYGGSGEDVFVHAREPPGSSPNEASLALKIAEQGELIRDEGEHETPTRLYIGDMERTPSPEDIVRDRDQLSSGEEEERMEVYNNVTLYKDQHDDKGFRKGGNEKPVSASVVSSERSDLNSGLFPKGITANRVKALEKAKSKRHRALQSQLNQFCCLCRKRLYIVERMIDHGYLFHRSCYRCTTCRTRLRIGQSVVNSVRSDDSEDERVEFYCYTHACTAGLFEVRQTDSKENEGTVNEKGLAPDSFIRNDEKSFLGDQLGIFADINRKIIRELSSSSLSSASQIPAQKKEERAGAGGAPIEDDAEDFEFVESFEEWPSEDESNLESLRLIEFDEAQDLQKGLENIDEEMTIIEKSGLSLEESLQVESEATQVTDDWLSLVKKKEELSKREAMLLKELQGKFQAMQC